MKNRKNTVLRVLAGILLLAMIGLLTACGGGAPSDDPSTPDESVVSTESSQPSSDDPTTSTTDLPEVAWIIADELTVSTAPGLGNAVIGGLLYGDQVKVLGRAGDWLRIEFGGTTEAYISRQYVQYTDPAINPPPTTTTTQQPTETVASTDPTDVSDGEGEASAESGEPTEGSEESVEETSENGSAGESYEETE